MLVTYCSVDFTLLFKYPYLFSVFSADKIWRQIWLAAFFSADFGRQKFGGKFSGGFGSTIEYTVATQIQE